MESDHSFYHVSQVQLLSNFTSLLVNKSFLTNKGVMFVATPQPFMRLVLQVSPLSGVMVLTGLHYIFFCSNLEARDAKGCTPLHICTVFGQRNTTCLLLERGADVEARDNEGSTPPHLASAFSDADMVCLLLKHGATAYQALPIVMV